MRQNIGFDDVLAFMFLFLVALAIIALIVSIPFSIVYDCRLSVYVDSLDDYNSFYKIVEQTDMGTFICEKSSSYRMFVVLENGSVVPFSYSNDDTWGVKRYLSTFDKEKYERIIHNDYKR